MESSEDIEKALGRLVPSAISERGQRALEGTIDGLSAAAAPHLVTPVPRSGWWTAAVAIPTAAAAALAVALVMSKGTPANNREVALKLPSEKTAGLLISNPVSTPVSRFSDDTQSGDMQSYVLIPSKKSAYINLATGKLELQVTREGASEFQINSPDGHELFRGNLEDPAFPPKFRSFAKKMQQALQSSIEKKSEE